MGYCLVIDLKKCVGCGGCSTICKAENGTLPHVFRLKMLRGEFGEYPNVKRLSLTTQCMQCANPPCVDVCPTGATFRDEESGIVSVEHGVCVGCKACMTACPYGSRSYMADTQGYYGALTDYEKVKYADKVSGTVDKCDFCKENRLSVGLEPACVSNCMANARYFGTREELAGLIRERSGYQLRPEVGTDPSIFYLP